MAVETINRPSEQATDPNRVAVIHSGAGGAERELSTWIAGVKPLVQEVKANRSVVFTGTVPTEPQKSAENFVFDNLERGNIVFDESHSMGTNQSMVNLQSIKERMGEKWEQIKDNLHLIVISPAVPKNRRRAILYSLKAAKMRFQEFANNRLQFPGRSRGYRSILAVSTILPHNFSEKKEKYVEGINQAYRRLSRKTDYYKTVTFDPEPERNYGAVAFNEKEQQRLRKYDGEAEKAIDGEKFSKLRGILHRRAQFTRKKLKKINAGDMTEKVGDTFITTPQIAKTKEGKKLRHKILFDMFFRGNGYKILKDMIASGVRTTIVSAKKDILHQHKEISELARAGKNVDVTVVDFTVHSGPWAQQSGIHKRLFELAA